MKFIMGIDIGGTEVKLGKFIGGELVTKYSLKTDISNYGNNIINDIFLAIDSLSSSDKLVGVGIGVPGPVLNGKVLGAQNLGWEEVDLASEFHQRYRDIKVVVLNDANAATYGELAYGAASGYHSLVMLTLGTGIGGGIVINDQLLEGATGAAGEVGHLRVSEVNPRHCTCGLFGCLEQYASATGVLKTAYELRKDQETALNKPNLTCKEVFDYAKLGDAVALSVVESMTDYLASGCASIADIVNPEIILLGGGLSKAGEFLRAKVEKKFKNLCFYAVNKTKFALATLGNDAGIYGAMHAVGKIL